MITATGRLDRVLVLGGDSDIGIAVAHRLVADRGASSVVLAGRSPAALQARAAGLEAAGADVICLDWDVTDMDRHEEVLGGVFAENDVDVTVLAAGVLGDQGRLEQDPDELLRVLTTNFTGPAAAVRVLTELLTTQGHGLLVVLSSIAATQARRANYGYGASKAGLDAFALGASDALDGTGARVVVIRPGFVRSSMTADLDEAPFACDPDDVAAAINNAIEQPRRTVHYVPPAVRYVSWVLRLLPRAVVRRLPR